jgi:hypothetical protein
VDDLNSNGLGHPGGRLSLFIYLFIYLFIHTLPHYRKGLVEAYLCTEILNVQLESFFLNFPTQEMGKIRAKRK